MPGNKRIKLDSLGKNVLLIGFKEIPKLTFERTKKIIENHTRKIGKISNYKELKLRLREHNQGKSTLYEIEAEAIITKTRKGGKTHIVGASSSSYKLNIALSDVLDKLYTEALHRKRTTKEIGEEIVKHKKK